MLMYTKLERKLSQFVSILETDVPKPRSLYIGMNKMVINHLEKLFVTSDASTIINELEVEHPAAKLLVLAAQAQQQEIGDGTNFVSSHYAIPLF